MVVAILAWRDRRPWLAVLIPFLVLAWANAHGSFFLGPAAVAVALLDDVVARRVGLAPRLGEVARIGDAAPSGVPSRRRLAWLGFVLILSLVATALTPFGPAVWTYALGIATNGEITRLITEWQWTLPNTVTGALFYASLAAAGAALWLARSREARCRAGRSSRGWPVSRSSASTRNAASPGGRSAAPVALCAGRGCPPRRRRRRSSGLLTATRTPHPETPSRPPPPRPVRGRSGASTVRSCVGLVLAIVVLQPIWRGGDPLTGPPGLLRDAPGDLAVALAEAAGPDDRAVVPQRWASWFEWAAPGIPVMVDSRVEVVPVSAWEDYLAIVAGGAGAARDTLEQDRCDGRRRRRPGDAERAQRRAADAGIGLAPVVRRRRRPAVHAGRVALADSVLLAPAP